MFFFKRVLGLELPSFKDYARGVCFFLPQRENQRKYSKDIFDVNIRKQGLKILGWRKVPVDSDVLGDIARISEPVIEQVFIGKSKTTQQREFLAKLYVARKLTEHHIYNSKISQSDYFYVSSLSNTTLIYKGIIRPEDIGDYYLDLKEDDLVTRLALVHQRFSTNTMPSWELAQPFRFLCQNGEINTLRGNISRMRGA